jgi:hypothetical protein
MSPWKICVKPQILGAVIFNTGRAAIPMNTSKSKKKAASKPAVRFKDLQSKRDPKGGRDVSVSEPTEPTLTKAT